MDKLQEEYIREKGYPIEEMWECNWWDQFKNNVGVNSFSFQNSLSANTLLQHMGNETIFGYVQYAIWVFQMNIKQTSWSFHLFSKILMLPETILGIIKCLMRKKRFDKKTATNIDIELQFNQRNLL